MKKTILFLCLFSVTACSLAGVVASETVADRPAATDKPAAIPARQPNDFAFRLYARLSKTEGNLFFSPASIEAALAMTAEGAAGTTRKQFDALLPASALTQSVPTIGTNVTLEAANAIWADQTFPILGTFKTAVEEQYAADIRTADFRKQPEAERLIINRWVEQKTRDKIKDLLPEGAVTPMTRLLLVNAIYFKGDWRHAFDPKQTADAPFWISPNQSIEVPMMRLNRKRFRTGETDEFQTLELPYIGEELSMVLILPKAKDGLPLVEKCFEPGGLAPCLGDMRLREVNVYLPRFKVESTFASLKRDLAALGLTDAFDARLSDFSGISKMPLVISDVVHKAFVEVNEKGTEAAAATGVMMRTTSIGMPPATFRADHPFVFLIRETASGKILFAGRVCTPRPAT